MFEDTIHVLPIDYNMYNSQDSSCYCYNNKLIKKYETIKKIIDSNN